MSPLTPMTALHRLQRGVDGTMRKMAIAPTVMLRGLFSRVLQVAEGVRMPVLPVEVVDPILFVAPRNLSPMEGQSKIDWIGGRLQHFYQVWEDLNAHPRVVSVLKQGYSLAFKNRPKLVRKPKILSSYTDSTREKVLCEAVQEMLLKKAIIPVQNTSSPGFYSRIFLVPKPNAKWRPVIDLSALNLFLNIPTFKMETVKIIRRRLAISNQTIGNQTLWISSSD